MNRIVLIGNGFDLAHKKRTSYNNFLKDYWKGIIENIKLLREFESYQDDNILIKQTPGNYTNASDFEDLQTSVFRYGKSKIEFKNSFLAHLTKIHGVNSWVDVETEYYFLLKTILNGQNHDQNEEIQKLNGDFKIIKTLLSDYLKRVDNSFNQSQCYETIRDIGFKIYENLNPKDFSESFLDKYANDQYSVIKDQLDFFLSNRMLPDNISQSNRLLIENINSLDPIKQIKKILRYGSASNYFDLVPNSTLLLNFNYTNTTNYYEDPRHFERFSDTLTKVSLNHIHGDLNNQKTNPMIFGFGDELDEDYMRIEKTNNNDFLENVKSINYLESDNLKKLLEFANSDDYQIYIMGHSCGVSDRTLLNTLFEHKNCATVKFFYHKKEDGTDNYSDIIRNISRNFNDKAIMRERVVNKKYCYPLEG